MENFQVYRDIQARTGGDIYIGVVGPVRTGKSTFIRRFMELVALPGMDEKMQKEVRDQLPLSGSGKMITTVEPKFIPKEAVSVDLGEDRKAKVRLIDCVGFLVKDAQTAPAIRIISIMRQGIISAWAMVCSISLKEIMCVCSYSCFSPRRWGVFFPLPAPQGRVTYLLLYFVCGFGLAVQQREEVGGAAFPLPPLWKADSLRSDCLGLTRVGVFFGGGFLGLGCLPLGAALHGLLVGQLALPQVLLDLLLALLLLALRQEQRLLYGSFPAVAGRAVQLHRPCGRQTGRTHSCVPASEALFDKRAAVYLAGGWAVAQGTGTPGQIQRQLSQGCLGVLFGKRRVPRRQRVLGALGDLLFAPVLNIKMLVGVEMAHGHTPPYGDVAVRKNADEPRQRTLLPSSQRRSAAANKFSFV